MHRSTSHIAAGENMHVGASFPQSKDQRAVCEGLDVLVCDSAPLFLSSAMQSQVSRPQFPR